MLILIRCFSLVEGFLFVIFNLCITINTKKRWFRKPDLCLDTQKKYVNIGCESNRFVLDAWKITSLALLNASCARHKEIVGIYVTWRLNTDNILYFHIKWFYFMIKAQKSMILFFFLLLHLSHCHTLTHTFTHFFVQSHESIATYNICASKKIKLNCNGREKRKITWVVNLWLSIKLHPFVPYAMHSRSKHMCLDVGVSNI